MKKPLLLIFVLIVYSSIFSQFTLDSMLHDGIMREYWTYVPATYDGSEEVPLLFNLHGYGSNAPQQNLYGDFRPIADTANFIIVLPEGTEDVGGSQFWNAGFGNPNVNDIAFIDALLTKVSNTYNIEADRIYSTGMSNGGFMSLTLACELSDKITAVASVTGTMTNLQAGNCNPNRPVPVMQIHGTADPTVAYNGSATNLGIETMVEQWVNRNGCIASPDTTDIPDTDMSDGCTAVRYNYGSCDPESEVVFYKVNDGGHTWPGTAIDFIGVTNNDFDASEVIWEFFSKYEHPTFTSIGTPALSQSLEIRVNNNTLEILNYEYDVSSIQIYDAMGKKMRLNSSLNSINLSHFNQGVYFIVLETDGGNRTGKFIR